MSAKLRLPVHRYVGRIVQMMRKERGMRQSELAVLTGLKQPNLSRIENGIVVPRQTTLEKLAVALDVAVKDLLSESKAREVEAKWDAVQSPRNAGQLFSGRLSAVPLYASNNGALPAFDASGRPSGPAPLTLQLLPLPGHAFGLRVADDSMQAARAPGDSFRPGEVVVFADRPPVSSGGYALVAAGERVVFRKVYFENAEAPLRLEALNKRYPAETVPRSEVRGMWRLVRRIQEF